MTTYLVFALNVVDINNKIKCNSKMILLVTFIVKTTKKNLTYSSLSMCMVVFFFLNTFILCKFTRRVSHNV